MAQHAKHPAGSTELSERDAGYLRGELLRVFSIRTADPTLAEDLAHEAIVHVLRGLPNFEGRANLRTWVHRIALNVWHDHLRRRAAGSVEREASGHGFSILSVLDAIGPQPPAPSPEEAVDQRNTHHCLVAAAQRLPLAEREVILLHDLAAISLERAAVTLGCSLGTAKVRLHRARRRLVEACRSDCRSEIARDGSTLCSPKLFSDEPAPSKRPTTPVRSSQKRRS